MLNRVISFLLLVVIASVSLPLTGWAEGEDDPLWNRPSFERKVYNVGQRILAANGIKERISFRVLNTQDVNATANRRGEPNTVRIYKGLLNYLDNDDELAAILSHEIAHLTMRHQRRIALKTMPFTILAAAIAGAAAYNAGATTPRTLPPSPVPAVQQMVAPPFQRKYETEADAVGVDYMVQAGYNPLAMETMLSKITSDAEPWLTFTATHPVGLKRLNDVRQKIATDYPQFLSSDLASVIPGAPYEIQAHPKGVIPTRVPDSRMAYADPSTASATTPETETEPANSPETEDLYRQLAVIAQGGSVETTPMETAEAEGPTTSNPVLPAPKKVDYSNTGATTRPAPKKVRYAFQSSRATAQTQVPPTELENMSVAETLLTLNANGLLLIKTLKQQQFMDFQAVKELMSMEGPALEALIHELWQKRLIRPLGAGTDQVIVLTDRATEALERE